MVILEHVAAAYGTSSRKECAPRLHEPNDTRIYLMREADVETSVYMINLPFLHDHTVPSPRTCRTQCPERVQWPGLTDKPAAHL